MLAIIYRVSDLIKENVPSLEDELITVVFL